MGAYGIKNDYLCNNCEEVLRDRWSEEEFTCPDCGNKNFTVIYLTPPAKKSHTTKNTDAMAKDLIENSFQKTDFNNNPSTHHAPKSDGVWGSDPNTLNKDIQSKVNQMLGQFQTGNLQGGFKQVGGLEPSGVDEKFLRAARREAKKELPVHYIGEGGRQWTGRMK